SCFVDRPWNLSNGISLSRRQRLGPYPDVLEGSHLHKLSQRLVTTPGEVARQIMQQVYTKATFRPRPRHFAPERPKTLTVESAKPEGLMAEEFHQRPFHAAVGPKSFHLGFAS